MKKSTKKTSAGIVFAAATSFALAFGTPTIAHAAYLGFSDLSTSHWAVSSGVVDWASENKVINGVDGRWLPDATISRAEASAVLWNAAGNPDPKGPATFTDAAYLSWAASAAAWCQQEGIFTGDSVTGNFNPWQPLTREQAAKVLMVREGGAAGSESTLDRFSDKSTVSSWATGPVAWAVENGVINGVDTASGRLVQGQRACTRAEFVAMLKNLEDDDSEIPGGGETTDPGQGGSSSGGGSTTDPDQGGTGGGTTDPEIPGGGETTDPETPAYDPYDIGNGDWVLRCNNDLDLGLDGQYASEFWANGKFYNQEPTFGILKSKDGKTQLHCLGRGYDESVADFKVAKTYDLEKQTIEVVATGINDYHGTLSITCKFKKVSFVYTGGFLCPDCRQAVNFYSPEGDSTKPRPVSFRCIDSSHGSSGSTECSLMQGKHYDNYYGDCVLSTTEQALSAGAYCANPKCGNFGKKLSSLYTNPSAPIPSAPEAGALRFEDHYLTE